MNAAALVLAAGASRRLGRPKQLECLQPVATQPERLQPERLLERAVRLAMESGCAPVLVVLGASAAELRATLDLRGATLVENPDWADGMSSSLQAGLRALPAGCPGVVVLGCDQPALTAAHLGALGALGLRTGQPVASSYAGRRGIPAYLPAGSFAALHQLRGDQGARVLLQQAAALDLPGGELDIDDEASLLEAQATFQHAS